MNEPLRIKANSHHHARQDKTALSVSRPLRKSELDSRQLKTVADKSDDTFIAIVQFTLAHQLNSTQQRTTDAGV